MSNSRLLLVIHIHGETESDLDASLEEVRRLVGQGFTRGTDRNESADYYFDISSSKH